MVFSLTLVRGKPPFRLGKDSRTAYLSLLAGRDAAGGLPVSARMACGSNRVGGRKQEPAETTTRGAIYA